MLKFGNKEFRNLQEQVEKNMQDISTIQAGTMVLDEFGIKVVGEETSVANMPTVEDYKENNPDWEYGDAYAIGEESPYEIYILTRANGTHADDYWFKIGEFPAPGPQGEQGETGPQGPQGQTGATGADGLDAGFGTVSATATTLQPGESATVSVSTSGPDTAMNIAFTFGIPEGQPGSDATAEWGEITGDLADQTDLVSALQAKQNTLVSGTNIKTINNESILGSGNIVIQGGGGDVTDVEVNGVSVVDQDGVAEVTVPTDTGDLTNNAGFITSSALSGYATETWVGQQGYLTSVSWSDVSGKPTFATVATSGSYNDLSDKPTIPVVDYPVTDVEVNGSSVLNNKVAEITVPTKVSDLTNDSGFITGITSSDVTTALGYTPGTSNFSGDYDDLTDKPDLSIYAESADLATVATTGDYDDLINKPTIPTATSQLNNDSGFITSSALSGYATLAGGTSSSRQSFTGYDNFTHSITVGSDSGAHTTLSSGSMSKTVSGGTTYTYSLPNKTGTVAMTSDIPSVSGYAKTYVGYQETQTFTGNNTFNISQVEPGDNYFETQQIKIVDTTSNQNRTLFEAISSFPQDSDGSYVNIDSDATTVGGDNTYIRGEDYLCIETDTTTGQIEVLSNAISISANSLTYNNNQVATVNQIPSVPVTDVEVDNVSIVSSGIAELTSETWTFTLSDGTTTTKKILVG